jgi:hypothetical protein
MGARILRDLALYLAMALVRPGYGLKPVPNQRWDDTTNTDHLLSRSATPWAGGRSRVDRAIKDQLMRAPRRSNFPEVQNAVSVQSNRPKW